MLAEHLTGSAQGQGKERGYDNGQEEKEKDSGVLYEKRRKYNTYTPNYPQNYPLQTLVASILQQFSRYLCRLYWLPTFGI